MPIQIPLQTLDKNQLSPISSNFGPITSNTPLTRGLNYTIPLSTATSATAVNTNDDMYPSIYKQFDDVCYDKERKDDEYGYKDYGGTEEKTSEMYKSDLNSGSFPDGGRLAYLTLFGSFMGLIIDFGIANSLGAIESYVSTHQLADIPSSSVSWVFTLHLGIMYFGGVIFGDLFDKYGSRLLLILSTIVMTLGLFLTAQSTKLVHFILSFGILTAIGTSLGMIPLIGVLNHWFLKKRALACSIATTGGLVGSSVFAVMLDKLYEKVGFQWALRVLGFICLFCMSIAIICIKDKPKTVVEPPKPQSFLGGLKSMIDLEVIRDLRFVFLTLSVFCCEMISISSLTYLTSYGIDHGMTNANSYLLITIVNCCGIPSRLITGVFADKYGRFNVMVVMSIFTTIIILGCWLPAGGNTSVMMVFSVLFGISTSATISLIPASASQICSYDKFGKVYGTLYFFLAFLTILGMYISSVVLGQRTIVNYRNFIIFEAVLSGVSILFWILGRYYCVGWKWCKF